jgi:Flp pilus assembly protein TadG
MTRPSNRFLKQPRGRERGVAAIELALLLPILIVTLAPLILYARYMWHYTVAQKAAQDAALYMSTISAAEMKAKPLANAAKGIAIEIARREVADLAPGEEIGDADVICDTNTCGFKTGSVPKTVTVSVAFHVTDPFFNTYLGRYGLPVEANVTMRYVGK